MKTLPNSDVSAESKGTLNITVTDGTTNGVAGVKITLTSKKDNTTYESTLSGIAGGCKIENLPYGQYTASITTVPTGYTATSISDITIDQPTQTLNAEVTI